MENPHTFEELKEHMGLPPWFTEAMLYPGVPIEIPAEDNTTVILSEGTIREAWPGAWSGTPDPKHTDVSLRPIRWQSLSVFGRCVIAACLMAMAGTFTIPLTLLVLAISHSLDFLPYGGTAFVLLVVGAVILFCYGMAWGIWVENDYPEQ